MGTGYGAHLLLIALPKAANPLRRKHKHVYPSIYTTNTLTTRHRSPSGVGFRKGPERQRRGRVSEGSARARRFPAPGRRWRRPARCWPGASSTCAATSGWTWARRWCGEATPLRPLVLLGFLPLSPQPLQLTRTGNVCFRAAPGGGGGGLGVPGRWQGGERGSYVVNQDLVVVLFIYLFLFIYSRVLYERKQCLSESCLLFGRRGSGNVNLPRKGGRKSSFPLPSHFFLFFRESHKGFPQVSASVFLLESLFLTINYAETCYKEERCICD